VRRHHCSSCGHLAVPCVLARHTVPPPTLRDRRSAASLPLSPLSVPCFSVGLSPSVVRSKRVGPVALWSGAAERSTHPGVASPPAWHAVHSDAMDGCCCGRTARLVSRAWCCCLSGFSRRVLAMLGVRGADCVPVRSLALLPPLGHVLNGCRGVFYCHATGWYGRIVSPLAHVTIIGHHGRRVGLLHRCRVCAPVPGRRLPDVPP